MLKSKEVRVLLAYMLEAHKTGNHPEIYSLEKKLIELTEKGEKLSETFVELAVALLVDTRYHEELVSLIGLEEPQLRVLVPSVIALADQDFPYVTLKQAKEMSGLSDTAIRHMKIPGSVFMGDIWLIPMAWLIREGYAE